MLRGSIESGHIPKHIARYSEASKSFSAQPTPLLPKRNDHGMVKFFTLIEEKELLGS